MTADRIQTTSGLLLTLTLLGCATPPIESLHAPFVATPPEVVREMLELARVGEGDLVYDLGSGDGRIVVAAAREFGARAVGFELDAELVEAARERAAEAGVAERVRFEQADLFEVDLRPASVVTLYLLQALNDRLVPRLETLAPGTRVVSHQYRLKGIRPDREIRMKNRNGQTDHTIFLWVLPFERQSR